MRPAGAIICLVTGVISRWPAAWILRHLTKTGTRQAFDLGTRDIAWVRLHTLQKADDPSPFPALTQLEVWSFDPIL